jgi:hypothetical protein
MHCPFFGGSGSGLRIDPQPLQNEFSAVFGLLQTLHVLVEPIQLKTSLSNGLSVRIKDCRSELLYCEK